jgi:hypothetical protein
MFDNDGRNISSLIGILGEMNKSSFFLFLFSIYDSIENIDFVHEKSNSFFRYSGQGWTGAKKPPR